MKTHTQNRRTLFLSFLACFAAVVPLLSSCDLFAYKRIFPDPYYDDNFIAHIGFDQAIASDAQIPDADPLLNEIVPPSAMWDFAWRYANDYASGEIPYPYMTLTLVADAGYETAGSAGFSSPLPLGLDSSSPVFRLEVENLVSDGDFEGIDPPNRPSRWASNLLLTAVGVFEGSGSINGKSLQIDMKSQDDYATYTIKMPEGAALENAGYDLLFKWASDNPINDKSGTYTVNNSVINFSNKDSEKVNFVSMTGNVLNLSNKTISNIIIDDIMLKRALSRPELRLRLSPRETEPRLMNMLYRFSVWVCADPLVVPVRSPYHLSGFILNINQLQTTQIDSMTIATGVYTYNPSASGWRKIEAYVSAGGNPQFPEDSLTPVIDLVVSLADSLPGRVLLAQPELRAYPDGY